MLSLRLRRDRQTWQAIQKTRSRQFWLPFCRRVYEVKYRSFLPVKILSLPELHQNPLVQRVIEIFDQDGNGEVDFKEFIEGVSQFSVKGDKDSKLKCKYNFHGKILRARKAIRSQVVLSEPIRSSHSSLEPIRSY